MGDGSLGFACGELEPACRARPPITCVVLANGGYGCIKASQRADKGGRYGKVAFTTADQAAIAAAHGVRSWLVEDPLALEAVLASLSLNLAIVARARPPADRAWSAAKRAVSRGPGARPLNVG